MNESFIIALARLDKYNEQRAVERFVKALMDLEDPWGAMLFMSNCLEKGRNDFRVKPEGFSPFSRLCICGSCSVTCCASLASLPRCLRNPSARVCTGCASVTGYRRHPRSWFLVFHIRLR